jgi:putative oxidoreductase
MLKRDWKQVLFGAPMGPGSAMAQRGLQGLALVLRLYAGGLVGFLAGLMGLRDLLVLGNIGFVPYGYDKLLGGNQQFAMGPDFFQAIGVPMPELTAVLIGGLELFGGLALILGLLTRPVALALAGTMLVALVTVNNWPEELPLLLACLLLVWLGGGMLSVDRLLDRGSGARSTGIAVREARGDRSAGQRAKQIGT